MNGENGPGGDRDRNAGGESKPERDFGDSAGYGGGGSALDYDEVLGDETSRRDIGPNPLDAVVHTGNDKPAGNDETEGADLPAGPHAKPSLTNEDATPGTGALPPAEPTQEDVDPGAG